MIFYLLWLPTLLGYLYDEFICTLCDVIHAYDQVTLKNNNNKKTVFSTESYFFKILENMPKLQLFDFPLNILLPTFN